MIKTPCARLSTLLLVLACSLAGCRTLNFGGLSSDRPNDKVAQDARPVSPLARPSKYSLRIAPYVFHSDFELKPELPLFKELASLRDQVYRELQLPLSTNAIDVFLFEDRDRYEKYMQAKYPDLPKRRAFFVAQPRAMGGQEELLVFTAWGDRIQQDLRHELTHALLHSVLKDVPLWLDEGLAEYFELPPDQQGVNAAHVAQLRRGPLAFKPDLARLEGLAQVQQMNPSEYRESWAWVHLMLRGPKEGRTVLLAYLQQLRNNPAPGLLRPRLTVAIPHLDEILQDHLKGLEEALRNAPMAKALTPGP